MNLETAEAIIDTILSLGAERKAPPLTIAVVDTAGMLVALKRQDGSPLIRPDVAMGKARTCIFWGKSSRGFAKLTADRPYFANSASDLAISPMVPAAGGLHVFSADGSLLGAVGVSGDTSDNDEAMAAGALEKLGLKTQLD